ncbi:MAG: hypothetical protein LC725_12580, partial [Lentisphaerae bacterium]|nr:hypothetical protein [Lentisphaerota bacterium]
VLAWAGMAVALEPGTGYAVGSYYDNPDVGENLSSFDWDAAGALYYTAGRADWNPGFKVYRHDENGLTNFFSDEEAFAGQVLRIGSRMYFNDGGTMDRWTADFYSYDPSSEDAPGNLGIQSDVWSVATRDGSDFWAAGGMDAEIFHSDLDEQGALVSNPLVNLGAIGASSGPLAFDADGNLYYAHGYNEYGPLMYHWSAAAVAAAMADPAGAPLNPTGAVFTALSVGDGASGLALDDEGYPLVTLTSFIAPSELQRLFVQDGRCVGYEVLARADQRLNTVRMRDGAIHVNSGAGIYTVTPILSMRIAAQMDDASALGMLGFNDRGQAARFDLIAGNTAPWQVCGKDGNRLLVQAGSGGAIAVAELSDAGALTGFHVIADAAPGWEVCGLDGGRVLAQAGFGGMIGIQGLDQEYAPGEFRVVAAAAPGWVARDLDGNRVLAQAGDGGEVAIVILNEHDQLMDTRLISDAIPGWIVRGLAGNLLLAQEGAGGATMVMELDEDSMPAGVRLALDPMPGWSLLGISLD